MARPGRVILAGQTYESLREAIIRGDIRPGERLNEARLASELGVSRTPVREALGRLEADGLAVREGVGLIAMVIDFGAASEVMLIRELLEPYCAETSAPSLSVAELSRLHSLVSEMRAVLESDGGEGFVLAELNIAFHDTLYSRCPYPRLLEEMRRSRDHFVTYWLYDLYSPAEFARSVKEHSRIAKVAERVASGDEVASVLGGIVREHIQRARATFDRRAEEAGTSQPSKAAAGRWQPREAT
jgi:DNA-binding GntR family transcriptional regulator